MNQAGFVRNEHINKGGDGGVRPQRGVWKRSVYKSGAMRPGLVVGNSHLRPHRPVQFHDLRLRGNPRIIRRTATRDSV